MLRPRVVLLLFSLATLAACLRKQAADALPQAPTAPAGQELSFALFDPAAAEVKVTAAELSTSLFQEKYTVPTLKLQLQGSDFVKILRCQQGSRVDLEAQLSSALSEEQRKWVWLDALGNPKQCKIVTQHFKGESFQDIAAKNAELFYVVNPCVSAGVSSLGREACSSNLALSPTLAYEQSPTEAFLKKAAELSDAESAYDAIISRLLGLSRSIAQQKQACEYALNHVASKDRVATLGWDLFSVAMATGGGLAARGLLAKSSLAQAPALSAGTLGVFSAAFVLSKVLRSVLDKPNLGKGGNACRKANASAQLLVDLQGSGELEQASQTLIRLSSELRALDQSFEGYSEATFR